MMFVVISCLDISRVWKSGMWPLEYVILFPVFQRPYFHTFLEKYPLLAKLLIRTGETTEILIDKYL